MGEELYNNYIKARRSGMTGQEAENAVNRGGGKVISIELALKLENSGLMWEPKSGDIVFDNMFESFGVVIAPSRLNEIYVRISFLGSSGWNHMDIKEGTWIPSLSQLLSEIEKLGWEADSVRTNTGYACDIYFLSQTVHTKYQTFEGETRDEAAGKALLWLLEQKVMMIKVGE